MPITAEYDHEADALYVRLSDQERVRAVEIDDATYVDIAADQSAVGIEFLAVSTGLNLQDAAARFSLDSEVPQILHAIGEANVPLINLTATGGQLMASTSMVTVAIEGTLATSSGASTAGGATSDQLITV